MYTTLLAEEDVEVDVDASTFKTRQVLSQLLTPIIEDRQEISKLNTDAATEQRACA